MASTHIITAKIIHLRVKSILTGLTIPVYQFRPECIIQTKFRCYVIPETQFYFRFEGDTSFYSVLARMRRFQSFLNLQRTLRLNEFVTRNNQYVTACCRQIISLTPNETCYFKRSLAIKNGNACSRLLQLDDAWLLLSRTKKKKSQKKVEAEVVSFLGPCNTPNNLRTSKFTLEG